MQNYNNAINPKETATFATDLMPCRSPKIKQTVARKKDEIGGMTNLVTATVYVPTDDNAEGRTIRSHEAMHASHTSKNRKPKDILDQALEDARLHRYCSKSSSSVYRQNREDELTVAYDELTRIAASPRLTPQSNLATLRAMGILSADTILPEHQTALDAVLSRIGPEARKDFAKALALLSDLKNWEKARRAVGQYFAEDFEEPPGKGGDSFGEDKPEDSEDEEPTGSGSKPEDSEDKPEDKEPETSKDKDSEDSKDKSDEDSEDESEPEDEDSEDSELTRPMPEHIAPVMPEPKPKKQKPGHADEYTADLTPACDKAVCDKMSANYPLKVFIRRLDMSSNRVKLSMGRKAPLPVVSGHKILARKLAGALINPGMRVFARSVAQGGNGTILIDASGSMAIPEETLKDFLSKAPALTLAFYNAPNDRYRETRHGNIFIYAANGYRASMPNIRDSAPGYGSGNLIDYQAMCWLLKQPAPRFLVTDSGYTGPWSDAAMRLQMKLHASKEVRFVYNLQQMTEILESMQ